MIRKLPAPSSAHGLHNKPACNGLIPPRLVPLAHRTPAATKAVRNTADLPSIVGGHAAALALSLLLAGSPVQDAGAAEPATISSTTPLLDLAGVVPDSLEERLSQQMIQVERAVLETGYKVRLLTRVGPNAGPTLDQIRAAWHPDDRTVVVLRRGFFIELQSRYGNMFYVREEGESAAVVNARQALLDCIAKPEGCAVVPGLPENQYTLTLGCSVIGGFVAGFASRLQPQGFVKRKFVWLLLFAPLWGTLFTNFGIGPIVTRTSDPVPVAANVAAFIAAAAVFWLSPLFEQSAIDGRDYLTKKANQQRDKDIKAEP